MKYVFITLKHDTITFAIFIFGELRSSVPKYFVHNSTRCGFGSIGKSNALPTPTENEEYLLNIFNYISNQLSPNNQLKIMVTITENR